MHETLFFIFSLKRSINIAQGVYININFVLLLKMYYACMRILLKFKCTLCFIIFLFYIKSILNIAHVQYSTCALYRDPTVREISISPLLTFFYPYFEG